MLSGFVCPKERARMVVTEVTEDTVTALCDYGS